MSRPYRIGFWLACALFSALIVAAACGDLWLDEIWSLRFARSANRAADIFLCFRHDNNHPLNTLFLYGLRNGRSFLVFRFFSVLSGIGSLLLMGHLARRAWGRREALFAVVLAGLSFPLLLYFSEARGYAPAIFFALLSFAALRANLENFRVWRMLLFWAASAAGILSHLTFAIAETSLLVLHLAHAIRAKGPVFRRLLAFLLHQAPPALFLAGWQAVFARHLTIGGGPVYAKMDVVTQAAMLALGFPDAPFFRWLALAAALAIIGLGTARLLRQGDLLGIFFPCVLLTASFAFFAVSRPVYLYFRYFLVCLPFFYLLLAFVIGRLWNSGRRRDRILLAGAVALMLAGQIPRIAALIKLGRGGYSRALAYFSEKSPESVIAVGSDHDFRNGMLIEFYAPLAAKDKTIRYVPNGQWDRTPPDWLITHSQELTANPSPEIYSSRIGRYRFVEEFRSAGISGWNWFLYRREQ